MNNPLTREIIRDCCTGREDEPAALANARVDPVTDRPLLEVDGPTTATPGPFDRYPDGMTRPSGRES